MHKSQLALYNWGAMDNGVHEWRTIIANFNVPEEKWLGLV